MFPYYSEEARKHLCAPDSPVLHLAFTQLAERLMSCADGTRFDQRIVRITALRTASNAVREYLPWDCVVYRFRMELEVPGDQAASDEAYRTIRTNWMRQAREQIEAQGLDPGPDAECMATPYGWNPSLTPPPVGHASDIAPPPRMTDERGRTWVLPCDNDAWFDLLNEYGRKHGRPTDAVIAAFSRHAQANLLYMLVLRGAEGERINLAARALALGPMPPIEFPLPPAQVNLPAPEERLKRRIEMQAMRDEKHLIELAAEAERMRLRGYTD